MEFMADVPDDYYELAIIDPPYGIDINSSGRLGHYGGSGKKWDSYIPEKVFFDQLFRISKNSIIWGGNYYLLPQTRCFVIWDKQQPPEISFSDCEYAWTSFNSKARIFRKWPQSEKRIHPTQKPVALYKWLLQNYAKPGDKIFDPHVGSGSIRIACHDMGFDFTGCEIDEGYWKAQEERYKNHIAQSELFTFEGGKVLD